MRKKSSLKFLFLSISFLLLYSININALELSYTPSDPDLQKQWYLKEINVYKAWDITRGKNTVTVAVIDSGVDTNHPDLKDNIWRNVDEIYGNGIDDDNNGYIDDVNGWDFLLSIPDPNPKIPIDYNNDSDLSVEGINHGTVVSGIIAASASNKTGISGIAPNVKIMPLRVLDGLGGGNMSNVVDAIDYAVKNGADIINMSFVGSSKSLYLEDKLKEISNEDVLIVVSAGNNVKDGGTNLDEKELYPICSDTLNNNFIVGVSAINQFEERAYFANYGSCVDVSAPGVSIYSTTFLDPDYENFKDPYSGYWSGTSMSAPIVSGILALMKSANEEIPKDQMIRILIDEGYTLKSDNIGVGVDAYSAVYKASANKFLKNANFTMYVGAGSGEKPIIKKITNTGYTEMEFLAYDENFRGGVNVAYGKLDGKKDFIVTGAGFTGGPQVRIFDTDGNLVRQFFAYDENFRGGVNVTVGDVNGDGKEEIITGAGFTGGPQVRIFDLYGNVIGQFFAYDENFRGGVNVTVGDLNGDGKEEIITGAGFTGGPQVRIFNESGEVMNQFFAFHQDFRGGITVGVIDINYDSIKEIIVGINKDASPYVRLYNKDAELLSQFLAYDENFYGGVNVTGFSPSGFTTPKIITSSNEYGGPQIRTFSIDGNVLNQFFIFDENLKGGVNISNIN
ncbi:hypothetical protein EOM09_01490 [bacterium]|nr:hypothetical protein [bacterium]